MAENKKKGMDIGRADTLVQAWQVMPWQRNPLPQDDQELNDLDARLRQTPEDPELHKLRGLRLAKLGYYREATECFSRAIVIDPFQWEYYRHRAHRFLSCRLFADAAADFTIASRLNPNDWNVWYHLGLSWFLLRDYEQADAAYKRCEKLCVTADDVAAVTDWHYITLRRLGREREAQALLDGTPDDLAVTDKVSGSYMLRLRLYKGLVGPEQLFEQVEPDRGAELAVITQGFGLANYWLWQGQRDKYEDMLDRVIRTAENSPWYAAFACLAAQVDKIQLSKSKEAAE